MAGSILDNFTHAQRCYMYTQLHADGIIFIIIWPEWITPECYDLIEYASCSWTEYFAVSVQHFAWPEWALLTGWSHSYQRWHWLLLAVLSLLKLMDTYDWKWTARERFKVLLSNPPWNGLTSLWRYRFRPKLLSSLLIEEATTRSYNKYIITL